jgi:hypothetical protein
MRSHTCSIGLKWKKVIFTDEMMIIIKPDGKLKVWRKCSEIWRSECLGYVAEAPFTNLKIMVWGCLTYHGVGTLAMINGNMNSVKYIETLDNNLWQIVAKHFGNTPCLFQDALNSEVMSVSVALRDIFTTLERVCSALLVTIIFLPVQGIFSVSPRILQRFKTLEIVDLLIFMLCAT